MEFADILTPTTVKVVSSYSSKKRLFMDLGTLAAEVHGLCPEDVVDGLLERESLGPTGVGHGVALPHARLEGVEKIIGMFVRIEKPIEFSAVDKQPVDLIFCLLAPKHSGVDHLKALALVSRTMRDRAVCSKLRSNVDPLTLHAILTEDQSSKAA